MGVTKVDLSIRQTTYWKLYGPNARRCLHCGLCRHSDLPDKSQDEKRPLIFVGHSLGGILIEQVWCVVLRARCALIRSLICQALVNAYANLKYSAIREST